MRSAMIPRPRPTSPTVLPAARWGALAGRTLGPYRLQSQIGAGGMGAVYRAWDERLGRSVAVKVLAARAAASPELERRLATEARAAAAIVHPNVVTIHDVGSADGITYVVAELVGGESVRSILDRGPVPRARVLRLAVDLLRGLGAAHAQSRPRWSWAPAWVAACSEKPSAATASHGCAVVR
jgi:serine/threonine protein kinase